MNRLELYVTCRAHWRNINRLATIDLMWADAHEELALYESHQIRDANIAAGQAALKEIRGLPMLGLKAFRESLNAQVQASGSSTA